MTRRLADLMLGVLVSATPLAAQPASDAAASMHVQLRYDGKPLQSNARAGITCRDDIRGQWIDCHIQADRRQPDYLMRRPPPGKYTLHVEVDDNADNPARLPGDYNVFQRITVTADSPSDVIVDVHRLIHLTTPWDNGKALEGMLTGTWETKPVYATPTFSLSRRRAMTFTWEPLTADAEYEYIVAVAGAGGRGPELVRGRTRATTIALEVPAAPDGQFETFRVVAHSNGRLIGEFFIHDGGAQGWECYFRVVDQSLPPWVYGTAILAAMLLIRLVMVLPWTRSPRLRWAAGGVLVLTIAVSFVVRIEKQRREEQIRQSEAQQQAERMQRATAFIAEWQAAVPKPDWWDAVQAGPLRIDSLGDLMSDWQTDKTSAQDNERFYKRVYEAILNHADDERIVPEAMLLLSYAEVDQRRRIAMLRFALDKFFHHKRRTDNCAGCKAGDTTASLVQNLAAAYLANQSYDAAIVLIDRLVAERETEVNRQGLALMFDLLARAHWANGQKDRAVEDIERGLRHVPTGSQADQLRRTLRTFQ